MTDSDGRQKVRGRNGRPAAFMPSLLVAGGIGYIGSAFVDWLAAGASTVVYALTIPATTGEFWMVGYLLPMSLSRRGRNFAKAGRRFAAATP